MPLGVAEAHQIPTRGVDRQRRIEDGPELEVLLEVGLPLGAAGLVDLVPEPGDLTETPLLVAGVHVDGPGLDDEILEQRFEVTVEMRHGVEAEPRGLDRVHLRDAALLQVRGGPEPDFLRLIQQSRHDVRTLGSELQSVDAIGGGPLDVLARHLRRGDRALVPAGTRPLEVHDAGSDDLVARGALLLLDREGVRAHRHAAHRGDAVRQPQLVGVFGLGVLRRTAGVHVHVDEPGQHVHARRVELVVRVLRSAVGAQREPRRAGAPNRRNPVVLDDDVDRARGRTAGAIDEHDAADDERLIRTLAFVCAAIGGRNELSARRRLCGRRS